MHSAKFCSLITAGLIIFLNLLSGFSQTLETNASSTGIGTKGLFTRFEGDRLNLYQWNPDTGEIKLFISEETQVLNARPFDVLHLAISPSGKNLLYRIDRNNFWSPIYLIDSDGKNQRKVLDKVNEFYWAPDGESVVYAKSPANISPEKEFWPAGYDWFRLWLNSSRSEPIAMSDKHFFWLHGWENVNTAVFSSANAFSTWLFSYDISEKAISTQRELFSDKRQLGQVTLNRDATHRIAIVRPFDSQQGRSCDIYELDRGWRLARKIVSTLNYYCESVFWNGDDEIIYNESTWSSGHFSMSETSESGYYLALSVYRYNFKARKEFPVLKSPGSEVYRLEGVLKDKGIVVSNESVPRKPRYILEYRRFDGSHSVKLAESEKEMWFVGWVN